MKRQYVIPDLLASLTADALFGVGTHLHPDEAAAAAETARRRAAQPGRISIWLENRRQRATKAKVALPFAPTTPKEST
ncbi:MAG: hypothetical protein ABI981_12740 [Betaproteobacteria bacterium]